MDVNCDVKPIHVGRSIAFEAARDEMLEHRGTMYPEIRGLRPDARERFTPFLDYDMEIRRVICLINVIESLTARFRRSIRARGHFPNEQVALQCLHPAVRSLNPAGKSAGTMGEQKETGIECVRLFLR
jgi:transposase-like protein